MNTRSTSEDERTLGTVAKKWRASGALLTHEETLKDAVFIARHAPENKYDFIDPVTGDPTAFCRRLVDCWIELNGRRWNIVTNHGGPLQTNASIGDGSMTGIRMEHHKATLKLMDADVVGIKTMKSVFGGEVLEVSGGCSVRLTFKQKGPTGQACS